MPFYSCVFKSLDATGDELRKAEAQEGEKSSLLLLLRLIRERTSQHLAVNLKAIALDISNKQKQSGDGKKVLVESWRLFPHIKMAFSLLAEELAAFELASQSVSNMHYLDMLLEYVWTCISALDDKKTMEQSALISDWLHSMLQILKDRESPSLLTRICSPMMWYLWGQSLIKIARNHLIPNEDPIRFPDLYNHHQSLYTHCLDLAATKFEKAIRLVQQNFKGIPTAGGSLNPVLRRLVSESCAAMGYIQLSKGRSIKDEALRTYVLQQAAAQFRDSYRVLPIQNGVYNMACVMSLQNKTLDCKLWLEEGSRLGYLPPLINVFDDPDLSPQIRGMAWFSELLATIPNDKSSSDNSWIFSQNISMALLQSTFAMPEMLTPDGPNNKTRPFEINFEIPSLHTPVNNDALLHAQIQAFVSQSIATPSPSKQELGKSVTPRSDSSKAQFGDLSESIVFDEELNKLQASLQRDGFSPSQIRDMIREVSNEKKALKKKNEEFEAAHARLMTRLTAAGMKQKSVIPGDGNCQFHSLSDQLFDTIEHSSWIRSQIIAWLRSHGDWILPENGAQLKDFAMDDWDSYCNTMAKPGIWGDHITLTAATQLFGIRIVLFSSINDDHYVTEYVPTIVVSPKILYLCHYAEYHYGSVCKDAPTDLLPIEEAHTLPSQANTSIPSEPSKA